MYGVSPSGIMPLDRLPCSMSTARELAPRGFTHRDTHAGFEMPCGRHAIGRSLPAREFKARVFLRPSPPASRILARVISATTNGSSWMGRRDCR